MLCMLLATVRPRAAPFATTSPGVTSPCPLAMWVRRPLLLLLRGRVWGAAAAATPTWPLPAAAATMCGITWRGRGRPTCPWWVVALTPWAPLPLRVTPSTASMVPPLLRVGVRPLLLLLLRGVAMAVSTTPTPTTAPGLLLVAVAAPLLLVVLMALPLPLPPASLLWPSTPGAWRGTLAGCRMALAAAVCVAAAAPGGSSSCCCCSCGCCRCRVLL
jgi:hypothetical protein